MAITVNSDNMMRFVSKLELPKIIRYGTRGLAVVCWASFIFYEIEGVQRS